MRRPLRQHAHHLIDDRFRRKRLSHALVLFLALGAAMYGVFRESVASTALEPSPAVREVVTGNVGAGDTAGIKPDATQVVRAQTPEQRQTSTGNGSSTGDGGASGGGTEPASDDTNAPAAATNAEATPGRQLTELERIQSLRLTPIATQSVNGTSSPLRTSTPVPSPTPTPTPSRPKCEPSDSPAFCIYTVEEGDSLSSLAGKFGMENKDLLGWELLVASNKPELTDVHDFLQPGQKLRIPTASGLVHTVILAETVGDLADIFDVTSASIIEANQLADANLLSIGQVVLIPNPKRLEPPPPPPPTPEPTPTESPRTPSSPSSPSSPAAPSGQSSSGFIWPITTSVNITSYFGPRHPLGIDLGLGHAPRSTIVAAASGKVVFAGGNACCSYGLYVVVQHDNGFQTLYGHLSRVDVRTGQSVAQGDALGPSGSTGYSTGFHLHFELSKNGARLNPLSYLP